MRTQLALTSSTRTLHAAPVHLSLLIPTTAAQSSPKRRLADEFGARYVVPFASVNDDSIIQKQQAKRNIETQQTLTTHQTEQHNIT